MLLEVLQVLSSQTVGKMNGHAMIHQVLVRCRHARYARLQRIIYLIYVFKPYVIYNKSLLEYLFNRSVNREHCFL